MTEQNKADEESGSSGWKRRSFFTAAAAAVAGLVARISQQTVEAGVDGDVVLGTGNTESSVTSIINTSSSSIVLQVTNNNGYDSWGLNASASGYGVIGRTNTLGTQTGGAGIYGETARTDSFGVYGVNSTGEAVRGQTTSGTAVSGVSTSGIGVNGQIPSSSTFYATAVYGLNLSTYGGASPGNGGFGLYGLSVKGHGLVGSTGTANGAGVVGASNSVPGAFAGVFYGSVLVVNGNFTVIGGAKSAAVPHPDGSHRRLYCVESPESWFEDFGGGTLDCGGAEVTIDPDFAAVADLSEYHVFVTGYGDHLLRVRERGALGFRVEAQDPSATGPFSWRIVAKRRDIAGVRFEPVTIPPALQLPVVSELVERPLPSAQPGKSRG